MERNIPDVRDIFGRGDSAPKQKQQELRTYDYSPRSRRRHEAMDSYDHRLPDNSTRTATTKERKPRHRTTDDPEPRKKPQQDGDGKGKDAAYYNNRTLTERDIRHLERHLSMKKTIRKQISRNLAQAFVDDPDLAMTEPPKSKTQPDRSFTLTRAKVSKSEQNVLDLLKDNEPDSGHCSADNPNSSDDDSHHQEHVRRVKEKASHGNSRSVQKQDVGYKDDGKFSFWKMFSVKNRGKR